jgi:hypothetical protein
VQRTSAALIAATRTPRRRFPSPWID